MTNEEFQKLALEQFEKINQQFEKMNQRFDRVDQRFENIETRMENIEGQMKETNDFVRVLLHRTEELDAKYDSLLHTVATKEFVTATINDAIGQADVYRVLVQDGDIQVLKRVK